VSLPDLLLRHCLSGLWHLHLSDLYYLLNLWGPLLRHCLSGQLLQHQLGRYFLVHPPGRSDRHYQLGLMGHPMGLLLLSGR
jgi:hypothetical protein